MVQAFQKRTVTAQTQTLKVVLSNSELKRTVTKLIKPALRAL